MRLTRGPACAPTGDGGNSDEDGSIEKHEGTCHSWSAVLTNVSGKLRYGRFCGGFMRRSNGKLLLFGVLGYFLCGIRPAIAQESATSRRAAAEQPASKGLSVDRIYSEPSLSGHLTPGIAWAPDGKHLSFFKQGSSGAGKGDGK